MNQHPEWSDKYAAIDGIAKPQNGGYPEERAIRSDIEEIINLDDSHFNYWYDSRLAATQRLLKDYELFASIPHLNYGGADQKYDMAALCAVSGQLEALTEALDFLEKIKQVRGEIKSEEK